MHGVYKPSRENLPDLKRLKPLHYEILRLTYLTYTREEVAKYMNVTPQTVTNTINSTLGQEELERLKADDAQQTQVLKNRIAEVRPEALKILVEDMKDKEVSAAVRSGNAKFILGELAGLTIKDTPNNPNHLTPAQMEAIKQLAIQSRQRSDERSMIENAEETEYTSVDN